LVDLLSASGKPHLAQQLHDYAGLIRYEPPELVLRPVKPLAGDFTRDLAASLKALTGAAWQVRALDEPSQPTLLEQEKAQAEALRRTVLDSPVVKAAFEAFPEAELTHFDLNDGAHDAQSR
jgi:DNA polymerase-3 subunit gamma/tau